MDDHEGDMSHEDVRDVREVYKTVSQLASGVRARHSDLLG